MTERRATRLADRITAAPRAHDPARGLDALNALPSLGPDAQALITGTAGTSGFLAGLIGREAAWLADAFDTPPEEALAGLLAPLPDPQALPDSLLRQRRRRLALLTALCDLGGVWALSEVTGALTAFADFALDTALLHHVGAEIDRGGLPAGAGGLFVLAMGKMGGGELNYSSDVDLICLFDETRYPPADYAQIRSGFVRVVQRMLRTLSAQTEEGYVWRTDLRLRPDPGSTPVCIGAGVAETYYETAGRAWERAALIKARPCAGDLAAGDAFLAAISPFMWRRHLDFAAIEDVHDMQRRIRSHKGLVGPVSMPGHNVKLGRGGIRSIEFVVQTCQLIGGGRDADLRGRATLPMLDRLAEKGWIAPEIATELAQGYEAHRAMEHRLQMLDDAQTHSVPRSEDGRRRLAALYGREDVERFEAEAQAQFQRIEDVVEAFFERSSGAPPVQIGAERLSELGYAQPERALGLLDRWASGSIPATRNARARAILTRIEGEIVTRLTAAASPDEALGRFDAFLSGLPAGVQILSLFEANPHLLDVLAEICAASPRLAQELARRAGVLDAVLDPGFFASMPGAAVQEADLAAQLDRASDYERVLDAARRWAHEQQFRAGVQLLRGIADATETGRALSAVAEAALGALMPHVLAARAGRHGPPPGRGAVVLAMGRFGSREMTLTSDLDLIVIYDADGAAYSDGPAPLAAPTYFGRLTKGLIAALSAPTAEGTLYEVDMRLRPSGRQGPVAVPLAGFAGYQRDEAWAWEHMALTRARVVSGPADLAEEVAAVIASVLSAPRDPKRLRREAREMRERIAQTHPQRGDAVWEVKHRPGGLLDIELLCQTGCLAVGFGEPGDAVWRGGHAPSDLLPVLADRGFLSAPEAEMLGQAHALASAVQQFARLAMAGPFRPEIAGVGLVAAMTHALDAPGLPALADRLTRLLDAAAACVTARLA
ncbi:MAG: bifunctional [glutamine synthetase] adenylyltransferase/[glutamine synthetase]-adenylyl-L-tyrosine phosphorylase [Pseudomonadota bacterium]